MDEEMLVDEEIILDDFTMITREIEEVEGES